MFFKTVAANKHIYLEDELKIYISIFFQNVF